MGVPYLVRIGERVTPVRAGADGALTLELDAATWPADHPGELLAAAPTETIRAEYPAFTLAVRAGADGRPVYRGEANGAEGPWRHHEEEALWALLDVLGDDRAPRACFFCRWSAFEPSTGWGNLGCMVDAGAALDAYYASGRPGKWVTSALLGELVWVHEWDGCARFAANPPGWGYGKRPRRA